MTVILVVLSLLFSTLDPNSGNTSSNPKGSDVPGMNDQDFIIGDDIQM